jgi:hypothetical protein
MKYAITGHTYGIGKTIFERLSPNVVGFSLTSGYDITKKEDRQRIIAEVQDCDVFINNAYEETNAQLKLFLELYASWKDTNKKIINVGSEITERELAVNQQSLGKYKLHKQLLKSAGESVSGSCTVQYKAFGYVNTPNIMEKYPTLTDYITQEQAADIILA